MSYFRRGSSDSEFAVDRLPIYVFPAIVGSGRILLGMGLAAVTTAVMLQSGACEKPIFWWLAATAYVSSFVLVVSGIFATTVPPGRGMRAPGALTPLGAEPPRPTGPVSPQLREAPTHAASEQPRGRLGELLVVRWQVITDEQLSRAQLERERSDRSLAFVLARRGLLTDDILAEILSVQPAAQDPWRDSPDRG